MARPGFWDDNKRASERSQEMAGLKREIERIEGLMGEADTLIDLYAMAADDDAMQKEIVARSIALTKEMTALETELFFSGKYDKGNAVLSVYAGAGGKDAEDWAAILIRMYGRFAEQRKWKVKIIHEHWGENSGPGGWGIKNATIAIMGSYAY